MYDKFLARVDGAFGRRGFWLRVDTVVLGSDLVELIWRASPTTMVWKEPAMSDTISLFEVRVMSANRTGSFAAPANSTG